MTKPNNNITTSLIVSTYNWPAALKVCLLSIKAQQTLPDEVIIADDGSNEDTKKLIDEMRPAFPVPILHVWQEDNGFQLAKIRNKAIAKASGDYIIQIDGDLLLQKDFIKDHLLFSEKNFFVTGSRLLMNEELSKKVLQSPLFKVGIFTRGVSNILNGVRAKALGNFLAMRYRSKKDPYYVKGCNMAFWKKDLIAVNGYNEDFVGWGKEDSELAIRLINHHIKKKFLKFQGVVYHIYHKEASRKLEQKNEMLMQASINNKLTRCTNGLDAYL